MAAVCVRIILRTLRGLLVYGTGGGAEYFSYFCAKNKIDKVYSVSDSGDGTRKRNRSNLVFLHEMVKKNVVGGCK